MCAYVRDSITRAPNKSTPPPLGGEMSTGRSPEGSRRTNTLDQITGSTGKGNKFQGADGSEILSETLSQTTRSANQALDYGAG